MKRPWFILLTLSIIVLGIYLFATAPTPLEEEASQQELIPIEKVFEILQTENATVRAMWTKDIVTAGKAAGMAFNENWRDQGVDAGPLPALFLRETAMQLEKNPVSLSLFLGSDQPINDANRFIGIQNDKFIAIRQTSKPEYFYDEGTQRFTAMFADIASAQGCVDCHNSSKESPKKDWALNDIMGATTWLYPKKAVSTDEMLILINALHESIAQVYQGYLDKTATFKNPPQIGTQWPKDGYYLPSLEVFMKEVKSRTAQTTLEAILDVTRDTHTSAETTNQ